MPTLNRYAAPQSTHFPGCWRNANHHPCTVTLVEELTAALAANMKWIGPPPTDKHNYDSIRETAWKMGKAALAKVSGEESNGN